MKYLVAIFLCMFVVSVGCATPAAINQRLDEKVEKWMADHPGEEMSDATKIQLGIEATAEIDKEMAQAREEAAKKLAEGIGAAASGNFVGLGAALLALLGIGLGAYKKMQGK